MGGPLKKYEVTTPSGVTTTMKLNEDDAKRLGVLDAPEQADEADSQAEAEAPSKSRSPRNKARAASDKGDG